MDETIWMTTTDVSDMLLFVDGFVDGRKLRLFAVACCRPIVPLHAEEAKRLSEVLDVVERYADGLASEEELSNAKAIIHAVGEAEDQAALTAEFGSDIPTDEDREFLLEVQQR